jgi:hypothetical protein
MLRERDLLTETEVAAMSRLAEVGHEVGAGKRARETPTSSHATCTTSCSRTARPALLL